MDGLSAYPAKPGKMTVLCCAVLCCAVLCCAVLVLVLVLVLCHVCAVLCHVAACAVSSFKTEPGNAACTALGS